MATATRPTSSAGAVWRNWVGDQSCSPAQILTPRTRDELIDAVGSTAAAGRRMKVPGSGHSFTESALTDDTMIRIEALDGILDVDRDAGLFKVEAGIVLAALNEALDAHGMALPNLGDIDRQTLAGAISTGTHGTGAELRNISAQVEAMELVTADGQIRELTAADTPAELAAARVGIGALGAIYSVTLRTCPAFVLHRVDEPRPLDEVLGGFHDLAAANDHFEFFVFPYTETALTLKRNRTERGPAPRSRLSRFVSDTVLENTVGDLALRFGRRFPSLIPRLTGLAARVMTQAEQRDRSYRLFANERRIRFTEMEYALPRDAGPEALTRVLSWIRENRYPVAMPIECRVVAPDDALISPSHERPSTYIAVHQYRGMEFGPYFEAIEQIFGEYGGRPHWGKRHTLSAGDLAGRYPRFGGFLAVRDRLDPGRAFANDYTERVLGP
jgi:L-gulonolactone oxidase